MKLIGKKIKEIRKKSGWSQDSILPGHQSLVSQIEKGIIKNPSKDKLGEIAKNLDLSFDELIEDTDWDPIKAKQNTSNEYAFSTKQFSVTVHESGEIEIGMRYFPRYNVRGEENRYNPYTGEELITSCPDDSCGRAIEQHRQNYCMSCGRALKTEKETFKHYTIENSNFWRDHDANKREQQRVEELFNKKIAERGRLTHYARNEGITPDDVGIRVDTVYEEVFPYEWMKDLTGDELLGIELNVDIEYEGGEIMKWGFVGEEDFLAAHNSKIPEVRQWWIDWNANFSFLDLLLRELKRYEMKILSEEKDTKAGAKQKTTGHLEKDSKSSSRKEQTSSASKKKKEKNEKKDG